MVKKTDEFEFDDFKFMGPEFDDFGDGGFQEDGNGQKGVRKAITDFGGSFLSGLRKNIFTKDKQRKYLKKALPKGYVSVFDAGNKAFEQASDLFDFTSSEVRKTADGLKEPVETLERVYGGKIKNEHYRDRVRSWAKDRPIGRQSESDEILDGMRTSLAEIFEKSSAQNTQDSQTLESTIRDSSNRELASNLATAQVSVDIAKSLRALISGTNQANAYREKVSFPLERKKLELQFRQYAIARQQLDIAQQTKEMLQKGIEAVVKNTGLPDAVKLQKMELAGQVMGQKLWGSVYDRASNSFSSITDRVMMNVKKKIGDSVNMYGGQAQNFMQTMAMGASTMESIRGIPGMQESRASKAGDMAGELLAELGPWLFNKYGNGVSDYLKNNPEIINFGNRLTNLTSKGTDYFDKTFSNDPSNGFLSILSNALDLKSLTYQDRVKVRGSAVSSIDSIAYWNLQDHLALTEVIPGHLEHIGNILNMIRTGDDSVSPLRYDYRKGLFTTTEDIRKDIKSGFVKEGTVERVKDGTDAIIKLLDPDGKLSEEAQKDLKRYIVQIAQRDRGNLDIRAMVSDNSPINGRSAQEVADVVSESMGLEFIHGYDANDPMKFISADWKGSDRYQFATQDAITQMDVMRGAIPRNMERAINHSRIGNLDILAELGIVTRNGGEWQYNREWEIERLLGNDPAPPVGGGPNPPIPPTLPGIDLAGPPNPNAGPNPNPYQPPSPPPPIPAPDPVDPDRRTSFQTELLEAIERFSSISVTEMTNTILTAIQAQLAAGIPTSSDSGSGSNDDASGPSKLAKIWDKLKGGSSFAWDKTKSLHKWSFKTAKNIVKSPFKLAASGISLLGSGLTGFKRQVSITSEKVKNGLSDIYTVGKDKVLLTADELKTGGYFDQATGKVIEKLSDIKGAVIDAAGNIKITEDDFKNGLYTLKGSKVFSLLGKAVSGVAGLVPLAIKTPFKVAWAIGKKSFNLVKKLIPKKDVDVYIEGEDQPRLFSTLMKLGHYFNDDGSVIRSIKDIKGIVKDKDGNTIISLDDLKKPFVDASGKAININKSSIFGMMKSVVKAPFRAASWIAKKSFKMVRGVVSGIGGGIRKLFGGKSKPKPGIFGAGGEESSFAIEMLAHQSDQMDAIYNVLDERLPKRNKVFGDTDGDGLREGSRESWLERLKNMRGDTEEKGKEEKEKPKSLWGLMMAAITGIGTIAGAIKGFGIKIWSMMRMAMQMRMAAQGAGILGSIFGNAGGGGRSGGRAGGKFGWLKNLGTGAFNFTKNNWGKIALAAGVSTLAMKSFAGSGASQQGGLAMGQSEKETIDQINKLTVDDGTGANNASGGSSAVDTQRSTSEVTDVTNEDVQDNMLKNVFGSMGGELAAILGMGGVAALMRKRRGNANMGPQQPTRLERMAAQGGAKGVLGTAGKFLLNTTPGRLVTAAGLGAGGYLGYNALTGNINEVDPLKSAALSTGTTVGLSGALMAAPWLYDKWKNRGATVPTITPSPVTPPSPSTFVGPQPPPTANPTMGPPRPIVGPMPNTTSPLPTGVPPAPTPTRPSLMSRVGSSLKGGIGPFGLGLAALQAYTTDGGVVDKASAFGTSLASTYAISKGLEYGIKGGRALLSSGARAAAMQAGRTAIMAGLASPAAPFVLGGLAVAAVGYLGYKAYQRWFKKDKMALARFRIAQYGFDIEDKDKASALLNFEQLLTPYAKTAKGGKTASFTQNIPLEKALELFKIGQTDKEGMERFKQWFYYRFRPIFLTSLAAANNVAGKKNLMTIDTDLRTREEKLEYLQLVNTYETKPNPYEVPLNPFSDNKGMEFETARSVEKAYDKAVRDVSKEKDRKTIDEDRNRKEEENKKRQDRIRIAAENDVMMKQQLNVFKAERDATQRELEQKADSSGGWWDRIKAVGYKAYNAVASSGVGQAVTRDAVNIGLVDAPIAKMSGNAEEMMLSLYKAFINAGFPDSSARVLVAEVGRENGYQEKYIFGTHSDMANGKLNVGLISWQGDRAPRLLAFLKANGIGMANGRLTPANQQNLNVQAKFLASELQVNPYKSYGKVLFAGGDTNQLFAATDKFIGWKTNASWSESHRQKRLGYLKRLNQLLAKNGTGAVTDPSKPTDSTVATVAANSNTKAGTMPAYMNTGGKAGVASPTLFDDKGGLNVPQVGSMTNVKQPATTTTATTGVGGHQTQSVTSTHRAYKAALYATKHALKNSSGYCARYVANALQAAGYKFVRQNSAFQYATRGILAGAGFKQVGNNGQYQVGDVMVYGAHGIGSRGGAIHGHIQIWNGKNWVSDFIQRSVTPGSKYGKVVPTLWRDSTALGKPLPTVAGGNAPTVTEKETAADPKGEKDPAIASNTSTGGVGIRKRTEFATGGEGVIASGVERANLTDFTTSKTTTSTSTTTPQTPTKPTSPRSIWEQAAATRTVGEEQAKVYSDRANAITVSTPLIKPPVTAPNTRANEKIEQAAPNVAQVTDKIVTAIAQRTSEEDARQQSELVNLGKQQLDVQTQTLKVLKDIRDKMTNQSPIDQRKQRDMAEEQLRSRDNRIPVNMSVKNI